MKEQVRKPIVAHDGKKEQHGGIGNLISGLCGCALVRFVFVDSNGCLVWMFKLSMPLLLLPCS